MALSHKKVRMITMFLMNNNGHLIKYAIKKNSRHIGKIGGLNNQAAPIAQMKRETMQSTQN